MDVTKIIKRPFQIRIPEGWEKHYFETSEDMLVDIIQSTGKNGYRKFAGGLILQRLSASIAPNTGYVTLTLPITFKTENIIALATQRYNSGGSTSLTINFTTQVSQNKITIYARESNNTVPTRYVSVDVVVLGY